MEMILFRRKTDNDPWIQAPAECQGVKQEHGWEYKYFLGQRRWQVDSALDHFKIPVDNLMQFRYNIVEVVRRNKRAARRGHINSEGATNVRTSLVGQDYRKPVRSVRLSWQRHTYQRP